MLILIRHGEATSNSKGLLLGRTDVQLTEKGKDQARALKGNLESPEKLISSSLIRARTTAELIFPDHLCSIDDRWIELNYGTFEGAPLGDVTHEAWQRWRKDSDFRPPGGESLRELQMRVVDACETLFSDHTRSARTHDIVVVSHVSPIKAAVAWALGVHENTVWRLYLNNATITKIAWNNGEPQLVTFNERPFR